MFYRPPGRVNPKVADNCLSPNPLPGRRAQRGDRDGLCEAYRRAGAKIVSEPEDKPWGLRDFRILDPDGHLFCFAGEIVRPKDAA
jgi:hypothetical protein